MSVLNQSGEEQVECPLCMEPLEVDDLNFYPCTCGYQICRFCWHRIRTDENGLCPACRKAYSENPADFIPLSQEQVAKLKAEKRQRDQQRKAKLSESRKHLASVRVVQRNLVFVVGLPVRLADAEVLKRHEYFGKFGKIHKVVINQSTSYAGSQGPSASAYVTYMKSDDALRAIQSVNNITIDGRLIKSSLGTTKYCSHFMKNQPCPKPDCMYLHDFGDPEASFTKEQMHAGKHQEYEKKLHDSLLQRMQNQNIAQQSSEADNKGNSGGKGNSNKGSSSKEAGGTSSSSNGTNKENWPQLNNGEKEKSDKKTENGSKEKPQKGKSKLKNGNGDGKKEKSRSGDTNYSNVNKEIKTDSKVIDKSQTDIKQTSSSREEKITTDIQTDNNTPKLPMLDDNTSFFSQNSFQKIVPEQPSDDENTDSTDSTQPTAILTDVFPNINTTEDWAAAFGFGSQKINLREPNKHTHQVKDTLETFGNGIASSYPNLESSLNKSEYNGFYEANKISESILDALSYNKLNGYTNSYKTEQNHFGQNKLLNQNSQSLGNNLDQTPLKFLMDAQQQQQQQQKNGQKDYYGKNGINGIQQHNGTVQAFPYERLMQTRQRFLEDQLYNLNIRYNNGDSQQSKPFGHINGVDVSSNNTQQPQNGTHLLHNMGGYPTSVKENTANHDEDELDFDPFQETQKAFAELMATEQKTLNSGRSSVPTIQMNGVSQNHSGVNHLPPPPPGFVQPNTHMNSFGSKILPFLNMSNSQQQQQQQINGSTQNNWPNGYLQFQQQQQMQQHQQIRSQQMRSQQPPQHKNMNTCHDWKTLDPAILSSSRHFPLANMPSARDHYNSIPQLDSQQLQNGGPLRSYDFTNNAFSNFTQQIQPNNFNFSHINTQQNLNWFASELNSQINSPPGFRNAAQTTKQQEC